MLLELLFHIFLTVVPVGFGEIVLTESPEQQVVTPEPDHNDHESSNCDTWEPSCRLRCINGGICDKSTNSLRFFLIGDSGGIPIFPYVTYAQKVVAKSLAKMGEDKGTEFIVSAGDNLYFTGAKDEFDSRFKDTFESVYQGSALQKPWYFIAGNHDHFGNISAQVAYTKRSPRWTYPASYYKITYVFGPDKTKVDFLMIDTIILCGNTRDVVEAGFFEMLFAEVDKNPNNPKDPQKAQAQLEWIEQHLSSSDANYLFVVGHYPIYSVSEHGPLECLINKLDPMLKKYRATVYVAGHDHTLQHLVTDYQSPKDPTVTETMHYIVTGAASRSDRSTKHMHDVPDNSLRFVYPTNFNPFSQLGLSNGGFVYVEMNNEQAEVIFYNGKGNEKYSAVLKPRLK